MLYVLFQFPQVTIPSMTEYDAEGHLSEDVSLNSRSNPSVVRGHIKASKTDFSIRGSMCTLGGRIMSCVR